MLPSFLDTLHPFLADGIADVPADFVKYALILLFAGTTLWQKFQKPKPLDINQPLVVMPAANYVTKEDFAEHKKERKESLDHLHKQLDGVERRLMERLKEVDKTYSERLETGSERMNKHTESIGRLEGRMTNVESVSRGGKRA